MRKIRDFESKYYWSPVIYIVLAEQEIQLTYEDNEMSSLDEAKEILTEIKDQKLVKVVQIESLNCKLKKPKPMNTNDLLIMAARKYGFDSDKTRLIAERLYGKGQISYPRTQGRNYTSLEEIQLIIIIIIFIQFITILLPRSAFHFSIGIPILRNERPTAFHVNSSENSRKAVGLSFLWIGIPIEKWKADRGNNNLFCQLFLTILITSIWNCKSNSTVVHEKIVTRPQNNCHSLFYFYILNFQKK